MPLSKIFGLSTCPVFWLYQSFDGQNKSGIRPLFLTFKNFAKMSKICQKFQKSMVSVKNWRLFSRFLTYVAKSGIIFSFLTIYRVIFDQFGQIGPFYKPENVKNVENFTGIFDILTVDSAFRPFGLSTNVKNKKEFSTLYFCQRLEAILPNFFSS